jgi:probable phosphoglycerate mutase
MLTVVLTRHGLTARSRPEQHLGQRIDVSLSDEGRAQAAALAARLARIAFDRIISSPLRRARETADAVAAATVDAPRPVVEMDPRILEMDYGDWEGLTYAEIEARDAAQRRRWEADPAAVACPNGESGDDVAARVRSFLGDLLAVGRSSAASGRGDAERRVAVVGHSTLNRILICLALGIPVREFRRRVVQGQVNLTVLQWPDGGRVDEAELLLLNDLSHVRHAPELPWE